MRPHMMLAISSSVSSACVSRTEPGRTAPVRADTARLSNSELTRYPKVWNLQRSICDIDFGNPEMATRACRARLHRNWKYQSGSELHRFDRNRRGCKDTPSPKLLR